MNQDGQEIDLSFTPKKWTWPTYKLTYPRRHIAEVFEKVEKMNEDPELRTNYEKWKKGINYKTNKKITLLGSVHRALERDFIICSHGARYRLNHFDNINKQKYLEETKTIYKTIDDDHEKDHSQKIARYGINRQNNVLIYMGLHERCVPKGILDLLKSEPHDLYCTETDESPYRIIRFEHPFRINGDEFKMYNESKGDVELQKKYKMWIRGYNFKTNNFIRIDDRVHYLLGKEFDIGPRNINIQQFDKIKITQSEYLQETKRITDGIDGKNMKLIKFIQEYSHNPIFRDN